MRKRLHIKTKIAFTLAEVLIVLGIIGVVAQMTIPTLMKDVEKQRSATAFKQTYQVLNQVSMQLISENGGDINGAYQYPEIMMDAFASKLKIQKACDRATAIGNCWSTNTKNLTGTNTVAMNSDSPAVILQNGVFVNVDAWFSDDCSYEWYPGKVGTKVCAMINIDTNGMKGPNLMGRDIFQFYQPNNIPLVPNGFPGTDDYDSGFSMCDTNDNGWYNGIACGGRILVEGGMKY